MSLFAHLSLAAAFVACLTLSRVAFAVPFELDVSGVGNDVSLSGLSVGSNDRSDFFGGTAAFDGTLAVEILFSDAAGDLDLYLFDGLGNLLGASASSSDDERVTADLLGGDDFVIEVRLFGAADVVDPDPFEPNDSIDVPADLGTGAGEPGIEVPAPATLLLVLAGGAAFVRRRECVSSSAVGRQLAM